MPDSDINDLEAEYDELEALIYLILAKALTEEEEETAVLLGILVLDQRRRACIRSGKYGARGPYNQEKTSALFNLILQRAPDRWFKSWFR